MFNRKKLSGGILTFLGLEKSWKKQASFRNTPLHYNKYLLNFFGGDGVDLKFEIEHKTEKYSLRNPSRMQNIKTAG